MAGSGSAGSGGMAHPHRPAHPRGQVLGRIADYERATELAGQLVRDAADDGTAWLARARTRTRATFHRFPNALADLGAAEHHGLDRGTLDAERATILQALGCHEQAGELHRRAAKRRPDFATLGALAVLLAERGEVAEAERLFAEARRSYQGVSPFPVASLDFRRGLMWDAEGNPPAARTWFDASLRRVPAYAPALGRLAEIDAALGAHEAAIDRLRPLACSSDDPGYAAQLACALSAAGRRREAEPRHARAAERYDELALRHPEAYTDHAADFRRHFRQPISPRTPSISPPPNSADQNRINVSIFSYVNSFRDDSTYKSAHSVNPPHYPAHAEHRHLASHRRHGERGRHRPTLLRR
jgi:tetratricopeptide (TPR) repeat protein